MKVSCSGICHDLACEGVADTERNSELSLQGFCEGHRGSPVAVEFFEAAGRIDLKQREGLFHQLKHFDAFNKDARAVFQHAFFVVIHAELKVVSS